MATHKDLDVWKESINFVVKIYKFTETFPDDERFGLISQIRRAAISIPSNIAEGAARQTNKENLYFLYVALGSITELETQLIIAEKLNYLKQNEDYFDWLQAIKAKLISYIRYVKSLKPIKI
ncbi:MAG: four helix bundle protein [Candidatus Marinimicrobia bacterium]|nr:four helix bundle protein [Candidatus Neomarinimicrobiota bacterium]